MMKTQELGDPPPRRCPGPARAPNAAPLTPGAKIVQRILYLTILIPEYMYTVYLSGTFRFLTGNICGLTYLFIYKQYSIIVFNLLCLLIMNISIKHFFYI